ncbi:1542_t:CDS:2 [Ambispora gerdemannii]|uniref:1542_t:CDS:1 n=1 Tax=Ambispora gerdemannii TaxID=144530 RepID=A0A9N8WCS6_9GLOM|nr:1542_t:CDS:2 [Ambispora gerdemannii]
MHANSLNDFLLARELGLIRPKNLQLWEKTRRTYSIASCTNKAFAQEHYAPINTLDIDYVEGRYLLSGGADSEIRLYDLENNPNTNSIRSTAGHDYSVTCIKWDPSNCEYFISSSMDQTIKMWNIGAMEEKSIKSVLTFNFDDHVYSLAISTIANHGLIAAALAHPNIRLCDIRARLALQSLKGHKNTVFRVEWSPIFEYMLVSACADGTVRIWDIRRADQSLISLDYLNKGEPSSLTNKAHNGGANGLCFTSDGTRILSSGHDQTIRLWDVHTGRNAMVDYPSIPNTTSLSLPLAVTPSTDCSPPLIFHPTSRSQIFVLDLYKGILIRQLQGSMTRVNCVVWRSNKHASKIEPVYLF